MGAKIVKQLEDGPLEQCINCTKETPYWWGDGCSPLCENCATKLSDNMVYQMSSAQGYGPLPDLKLKKHLFS